jgi:hypothetical protein
MAGCLPITSILFLLNKQKVPFTTPQPQDRSDGQQDNQPQVLVPEFYAVQGELLQETYFGRRVT